MLKTNRYSLSAADKVMQVIATLEIENMHVDAVTKNNLFLMATHQKSSEEVIEELKKKYAR